MANKQRKYKEVLPQAHKPMKERKATVKGRDGSLRKARNYAMDDGEARKLRAQFRKTGEFPNPFRKAGAYQAFVQSLIDLGVDKRHTFSAVKKQMTKLMKAHKPKEDGPNGWDAFQSPSNGKPDVGKDVNGRIIQNAEVLQRLTGYHPYGWKLSQLHACIDIHEGKGGQRMFSLNTTAKSQDAVSPVNEFRRVRKAKPKTAATKPRKAAGSKKTAKKVAKKTAKKATGSKAKPKAKPKKATGSKKTAKKASKPAAKAPEPSAEPSADDQAAAAAAAAALTGAQPSTD